MKLSLPDVKLGQTIKAKVDDILPGNELLINFHGDLIRVANETTKIIKRGQMIELIVTAIKPLQFRLASHANDNKSGRPKLDMSV
jgi:hypothetical protein